MNQLTINTTQNVKINFNQASISSRLVAFVIDVICVLLYALAIFLLWKKFKLNHYFSGNIMQFSVLGILLLPGVFYSLLMESLFNGVSFGKKIMKLKVIKSDGYQAGFMDYLTRWVFRIIDVLLAFGIFGLLSVIATKHGQRLGDLAAGTAVISTKKQASLELSLYEEIQDQYVLTYPQVLRLSDQDINRIKEVMVDYEKSQNHKLLTTLQAKIEKTIGAPSKHSVPKVYIDTIVKDYNFLSQKNA